MNLPERPLSSNFTTPSIIANSVSSLPRPTFLPGFHFVPRWRARMLPPSTRSPPNFLSPSRCEFESRPKFGGERSEEHTSELQSQSNLVCRLLLEKKKNKINTRHRHNITDYQ